MRQLAKIARLDRDKGMRGDGFEWAVHEAIVGGEPLVTDLIATVLPRLSPRSFRAMDQPSSLLFGYERAKYLGFLDAVVENAGGDALLLPDGKQGRPFYFGPWVTVAAQGQRAEPSLRPRISESMENRSLPFLGGLVALRRSDGEKQLETTRGGAGSASRHRP